MSQRATANPTVDIFAPIGLVREKAPQVRDARNGDGQQLLDDNRRLLLCQNLARQQLCFLQQLKKMFGRKKKIDHVRDHKAIILNIILLLIFERYNLLCLHVLY